MNNILSGWRRLTDAPAGIVDPEVRQKTRLLCRLLLGLIPLGFLAIVLQAPHLDHFWPTFLTVLTALALLAVAYGLARTGFYRIGAMLTLIVTPLASFAAILINPDDQMAYGIMLVSIILATMLFDAKGALITGVVNLAGVTLLLPVLGVSLPEQDVVAVPMLFVIVTVLLLISIYARNRLENVRQQSVRDSESRYRTIVETAQEGIWTMDAGARITFVNRKMADMLGYSVKDMLGRHLFDFLDEEGQAIAKKNIARRQQGVTEQVEIKYLTKSGDSLWTEINATPLIDAQGEYAGSLAMVTDITERRRAERSLLEMARAVTATSSEDFFPLLVAHLSRALEADIAFVAELLPDKKDHVRTISLHLDNRSQANFEYALATTPCENVVAQGTCSYPRNVQQQFPEDRLLVEMGAHAYVGTPLYDANGICLGLIAVLFRHPITGEAKIASTLEIFAARARSELERLQSERAIRDSEANYRHLFENMTSGFALHEIICDQQGKPVDYRYIQANPAFEKLTGVPVSNVVGKRLRELMPNTEDYWIETFGKVALTGEPIAYENFSREIGKYFDTWVFSPKRNQFAVIFSDITARKRAEDQLLAVARGVSMPAGGDFFATFTQQLTETLEADFGFVALLRFDTPVKLETLALVGQGQVQNNIVFDLEGTPCVDVVRRGTCSFQQDVRKAFPENPYLATMEAQAYVGAPLLATDGRVLGVVAVLYCHPLAQVASIESMLEIFASRAATELERLRAETQMQKLSSAIEQTADMVIITDRKGKIEYVNPAFERTTGYAAAEAIGRTPSLVKSGKQDTALYQKLWQTILSGEVYNEVLINRRKDGSLYYEEKTITPLKDETGRVTHFISTGKDVTERMQTQERLEFMAQHDALTALPNRALLLDRLKQSVARARWHQRMVAVLFIDLDRFKTINDTLGHEAGDQLLMQLGERFSRIVREGDTVGRFGGDEFVILLDDVASDKDISGVAQKVLDALKAPFDIQQQHLYISASIGISLFPNDGEDGNTLLRNADIAMYRAKEMGKNTYQFYSADMSARAFERLSLESSLRHALERQEFVLHYQPQFDVRTGRIFGVEALLRWQHPDFGLVPPADFISLLEETGLIVPVGEWVLEEAGRQISAWNEVGHRNLRLSVNLSPRQAQASTLLATVQRVLSQQPDAVGWLELEITEGLLVQQSQPLMETFDALRALGVRLSIDDFGTGYSSLAYLRRLPIDSLKVDRSFVRDVPGDADDSAIVTTIIAMAQSLRLEVIAEGVENSEQRDFLSAYGCTRMQGYLFAQPMPAAELTRLLAGAGSESATG